MQTFELVGFIVAAVSVITVLIVSEQQKNRLFEFRKTLVKGMDIAVYKPEMKGYIKATVAEIQPNSDEILIILDNEKNVRLFPLKHTFPTTYL